MKLDIDTTIGIILILLVLNGIIRNDWVPLFVGITAIVFLIMLQDS